MVFMNYRIFYRLSLTNRYISSRFDFYSAPSLDISGFYSATYGGI